MNLKLITVLFFAALFAGCVATQLIGSQKTSDAAPKQYQKLGVVVLSPQMSNRATVEVAVAEAFRAKGVKAIATYDIFPMAGKIEEIKQNMDQEAIQQKIRERVTANNLDALLIITLFDKTKETHYVQGSSFSISAPVYGFPYYGYYGYAYSSVYDPGYYATTTNYFIESNLYDVSTEKLLWTGQTKTQDPQSVEKEAPFFAKLITDEILEKKVLLP
jgi:hypothetical protein